MRNFAIQMYIEKTNTLAVIPGKSPRTAAVIPGTSLRTAIDKFFKTKFCHTTPLEGKRLDNQIKPGEKIHIIMCLANEAEQA